LTREEKERENRTDLIILREERLVRAGGTFITGRRVGIGWISHRIVRTQRREIEVDGGWLGRNNAGRQRWTFHAWIEWMQSISRRAEGKKESVRIPPLYYTTRTICVFLFFR
jgi:hypothetical protein